MTSKAAIRQFLQRNSIWNGQVKQCDQTHITSFPNESSVSVNSEYIVIACKSHSSGFLVYASREGLSPSLELYNNRQLLEKYHTYLRVLHVLVYEVT